MSKSQQNRIHAAQAESRLEYLRGEIRAQRISYAEIAELESLAPFIAAGDVELLEWAGVPEHRDGEMTTFRIHDDKSESVTPNPAIEWTKPLTAVGPANNPRARLLGTVEILGTLFHVNAEQVHDCDTGGDFTEQLGVLEDDETYVNEIQALCDGAGETIKIDGREYLLVISPYQR